MAMIFVFVFVLQTKKPRKEAIIMKQINEAADW
jgi:hypothetical protein